MTQWESEAWRGVERTGASPCLTAVACFESGRRGSISSMLDAPGLEINADLFAALLEVVGRPPAEPEPIIVLSQYLYSLTSGYGLSDSSELSGAHLDDLDPPAMTAPLIDHYLGLGSAQVNAEDLRNQLYSVFVELSGEERARRLLNKAKPIHEVGLLLVAQVCWNLEARGSRVSLPIKPGVGGDIPVQSGRGDFARMSWTDRTNAGVAGLGDGRAANSSGASLRLKAAVLAVLAAERIISRRPQPPSALDGALLHVITPDRGKPRASIMRPATEESQAARTIMSSRAADPAPGTAPGADKQVRVGRFAEVGSDYQLRELDDEIERLWIDRADRRVWLRGQPGLGKSYTARRIIQDAAANHGGDRDDLLIWVDSADSKAVASALSEAADKMPHLGIGVEPDDLRRVEKQAERLLEALETSTWRWLIVLDNAEASSLLTARLIPGGRNPNGRVLITTLSRDTRMAKHGHVVKATVFDPQEAEGYLRSQVDPNSGGPASIASASPSETKHLAEAVGFHPLALSIASATITANAMDVADWIADFRNTTDMDDAADQGDAGGYPHLIGATWRVALEKASRGLPPGTVERAAAVAAVQDPDGHPTWLWACDTLTTWVAKGRALEQRPGRPPVVIQRLIENGIVELVGGTWKEGRLAIHQLAARAVRELIPNSDLAELGAMLTEEWLRHVVVDSSLIQGNLQALLEFVDLTDLARTTVSALLDFADARSHTDAVGLRRMLVSRQSEQRGLESVIDHVGPGLKKVAASRAEVVGEIYGQLGDEVESRRHFRRAVELHRSVIDDPEATDAERADALVQVARSWAATNQQKKAKSDRKRAAQLYQRVIDASQDPATTLKYMTALSDLYDVLGKPDEAIAALARHYEQLRGLGDATHDNDDEHSVDPHLLMKLALVQRSLEKFDDAKETMTRAAAAFWSAGDESMARLADLGVVRLHVETSNWSDVEESLARLVHIEGRNDDRAMADDLVRLASARIRHRHTESVADLLTRAVGMYEAIASESSPAIDPAEDDEIRRDLRDLGIYAGFEFGHGRFANAQQIYARQLGLLQERAVVAAGDHENDLADALHNLGFTHLRQQEFREAAAFFASEERIRQTLADLAPGEDLSVQRRLGDSLKALTVAYSMAGDDQAEAEAGLRAVDVRTRIADADLEDEDAQSNLAFELLTLGLALRRLNRHDEAHDAWEHALVIRRALAHNRLDDREAQSDVADVLRLLAQNLHEQGRLNEAAAPLRELESHLKRMADHDLDTREHDRALPFLLVSHGTGLVAEGQYAEGKDSLERAVQGFQRLLAVESTVSDARTRLVSAHALLAALYDRPEDEAQRLAHTRDAEQLLAQNPVLDPGDLDAQLRFALLMGAVGLALHEVGRSDEAIEHLNAAADVLQFLLEMDFEAEEADIVGSLNLTLMRLSDIHGSAGRHEDAAAALSRAADVRFRFPGPDGSRDE